MVEWSLTGWLDPFFKWFADQAGIPVSEYTPHVGGEVLGTTVEYGSELIARPLLAKTAQFFFGLTSTVIGTWFRPPERLRKELIQMGIHDLLRVGKPTSLELLALKRNAEDVASAIQRQDWDALMKSLFQSPPEQLTAIQTFFGVPSPRPPALPPTEVKKYEVKPETQTETPGTRGKYQITE